MTAPSQDQSSTTNTAQSVTQTGKYGWRLRLIIVVTASILIVVIILWLLTYYKILPSNLFAPLLTILTPIFGSLGAFLNAIFSNKDFQQSVVKWFDQRVLGNSDVKQDGKDVKDANTATQAAPSINVTTTINTNGNPSIATLAGAQPTPATPDQTQQPTPAPDTPPITSHQALTDSSKQEQELIRLGRF